MAELPKFNYQKLFSVSVFDQSSGFCLININGERILRPRILEFLNPGKILSESKQITMLSTHICMGAVFLIYYL